MLYVGAEKFRPYLTQLVEETGFSLSEIARKSGINPATLTRPMNKKGHRGQIRLSTLRQVARAMGKALPPSIDPAGPDAVPGSYSPLQLAALVATIIPTGKALSEEDKARLVEEIVRLLAKHGAVRGLR